MYIFSFHYDPILKKLNSPKMKHSFGGICEFGAQSGVSTVKSILGDPKKWDPMTLIQELCIFGLWFGTFFMFPYILGIRIPTHELIFFKGVGQPPTRSYNLV